MLPSLALAKEALARRCIEWCVRAPTIEASTAVTAIAQEERGQAAVLSALGRDLGQAAARPGAPAAAGCEPPPGALEPAPRWTDLIALLALLDRAVTVALSAEAAAHPATLGRSTVKVLQEERFHEMFARRWFALPAGHAATRGDLLERAAALRAEVGAWLDRLGSLRAAGAADGRPSPSLRAVWAAECAEALGLADGAEPPAGTGGPSGSAR